MLRACEPIIGKTYSRDTFLFTIHGNHMSTRYTRQMHSTNSFKFNGISLFASSQSALSLTFDWLRNLACSGYIKEPRNIIMVDIINKNKVIKNKY